MNECEEIKSVICGECLTLMFKLDDSNYKCPLCRKVLLNDVYTTPCELAYKNLNEIEKDYADTTENNNFDLYLIYGKV